jgi:hypothetical protein
MEIYYVPALLAAAALTAQVARSRQLDASALAAMVMVAIVISGLRWRSDVDYAGYLEIYAGTPPLSRFSLSSIAGVYGEPGYLLLSSVFKSLGLDFFVLAFLSTLASLLLKSFVFFRLSPHASLAIGLYFALHFITIEFIQMRWAVATGFIALGFYMQYRGRNVAAALALAGAVVFHYFSLAFWIVALFLASKGYRRFQLLFAFSVIAAAFSLIDYVAPLLITESEWSLLRRLSGHVEAGLGTLGPFSYAKIFMYPSIYAACVWTRPGFAWREDPLNVFLHKAALTTLSVPLLLSFLPILHYRAFVVGDMFAILWVVNSMHVALSRGVRMIALAGLTVLFCTWHVMDVGNYIDANRLYPYRTWLTSLR